MHNRAVTISRSTTFIPISGLTNITSIGAGRWHALAVNTTGQVYAWGYGIYGQLGNGTSITSQYSPVAVGTLTNVSCVAAGQYQSVARKSDGTVWAWGYNANGQVGNTTSTDKKNPKSGGPSGAALTTVTLIAAGLSHNVAARADGTVAVWGYNANHYHPVSVEWTSWNTMVASELSESRSVSDLKAAVKKAAVF